MLTCFSAVKKMLFPFFWEFIAGKSTFISFSRHFIALKTVVVPIEDGRHSNEDGHHRDYDGRHGDKALKLSLDIWDTARPCLEIFDSPGVNFYHFVGISTFR